MNDPESWIASAIRMIADYAATPDCEPFKPTRVALRPLPGAEQPLFVQPLFVLGANDAEMDCIEALCDAGSVPNAYAMVKDASTGQARRIRPGEVVTSDNDATRDSYSSGKTPRDYASAYAVEVTGGPVLWGAAEIDHHFNALAKAPPDYAFEASSLGQFLAALLKHYVAADVSRLLGIEGLCDLKRVPLALRTEGAADHNLGATLGGGVPGIDPMIAAAYILKTRANTYLPGFFWEAVLEVFKMCSRTLLTAPLHPSWADSPIRDLTDRLAEEGYDRPAFNGEACPLALRLLPVVAAFWGLSYAARIKTAHGWGLRIGGGGPNLAAAVSRLKDPGFAQSLGLKVNAPAPQNVYAFPERGIGGGTFAE